MMSGKVGGDVKDTRPRRKTWQREAVREALLAQPTFVSAQQLHESLRRSGSSIGLATVYRQLSKLADDDLADVLQSEDGEMLFRNCETDTHHHHLVCTVCGRVSEVQAPEVENWVSKLAESESFHVTHHVANVFGVCAHCSAKADADC
jgi:Fur family ferric uptake transcriptional regulator